LLFNQLWSGKNSEGPAENSWVDLCPAKWKQISKSLHVGAAFPIVLRLFFIKALTNWKQSRSFSDYWHSLCYCLFPFRTQWQTDRWQSITTD
jgi:hypothetical protein